MAAFSNMSPRCVFTPLLLLLLLVVSTALLCEAQSLSEKWTMFTIFESRYCVGCSQGQTDGPSGVGILFTSAGGSISKDGSSLLLCDIGGGGSSIRVVNETGIYTIAGSHVRQGMLDGPADTALFASPQSVVYEDGSLYVADTDNNNIRQISSDLQVRTFIGAGLVSPQYIMPYQRPTGSHDLFISDTGNARVIFVPVQSSTFVTEFVKGFQPNLLQIDESRRMMYAIKSSSQIVAINMREGSLTQKHWEIGNISCAGYIGSLMLTADGSELYYFGRIQGKKYVLSLSTLEPPDTAMEQCPKIVMEWTMGDITSLVTLNQYEFYIVTTSNVYLIRDKSYTPTKEVTASLTLTPTSTPTFTHTPTPTPPIIPTREHIVAAFPAASLPIADNELMHQLYAWLMKDVGIALGTTDFIALFGPNGETEVPGNVNVSGWNSLKPNMNKNEDILIMEYLTPPSMTAEEGQNRLFASPWYWTRKFLDSLEQSEQWAALEPFCMIDCVEQCMTMVFDETMCLDYVKPPACNDVCVGAVVSSAVLGVTGVALMGLIFGSSANALSAVLLVPPV